MAELRLSDLVLEGMCIDPKKAEPVFELILKYLRKGEPVCLSFAGISRVITAFLNVAIGKLYDPQLDLPVDVDESLSFKDISEDNQLKAEQVIKYAKLFYQNRPRFNKIVEDED
ncbi:STAS-like domain-containing protein [Pyramidobacter piscolens]|uniref:STAS-like domain-containing protein n=1 Tax=Pyramidobacter piscolens TaxID=638849 RepID=UPI002491F508|nr:STAS-like domain-containing protein [Pyramidobacter piscolens]